ncbi:MAG: hypothetical protein RIM99_01775 [Cyclobacteriaceae bacterium]
MEEQGIFSKNTITLLEDNGYSVKVKGLVVSFLHTSRDRIGLILVGSLLFLSSFILLVVSNVAVWIVSVSLLLIVLILIGRRIADRDLLMFDLKDKTFFHKKNSSSIWLHLNNISDIILKSSSKGGSLIEPSDEDHQITISLILDSNKKLVLFKFHSDFQHPSIQVKEIYNWIKSIATETQVKPVYTDSQNSVSG